MFWTCFGLCAATPVVSVTVLSQLGLSREWRRLDYFLSCCASLVRLGAGRTVADTESAGRQESLGLVLYEYEGCPFCRRVRETLTELNVDCEIRPCPRPTFDATAADAVEKGLSRFRPDVLTMGGKLQVPFLIDNDSEPPVHMYDSSAIVDYLWRKFGDIELKSRRLSWKIPGAELASLLSTFTASLLRSEPRMGLLRVPTKTPPKEPLLMQSYEAHPGCRLVREALCVLELPWILHPAGVGSWRNNMLSAEGKTVPWFCDPNTGFTSSDAEISIRYLFTQYAAGESAMDFDIVWVWKMRFKALGRGLGELRRPRAS